MKGLLPDKNGFKKFIPPSLTLLVLVLAAICPAYSQEKKKVEILHADALDQKADIKNAQRLLGNVKLLHNGALMFCDSAYIYSDTNNIDAFGHVVINQGDTVLLNSKNLFYIGNLHEATAVGDVHLKNINQGTVLTSDTLIFNMNENIGYFDYYGQIVDSTNTLSSLIGQYHISNNMAYFYIDVEVQNKDFSLLSDTLSYNTQTGVIDIEGPTTIKDTVNTIYAEDGWYDSKTGEAELLKNPFLQNKTQSIKGDTIEYFREAAKGFAYGNVEIIDQENQVKVNGNIVAYDKDLSLSMVTDSALLTLFSETDTLFLHADTITSAPDTIADEKIMKAFHSVRFFRNNIQGVCDSLVYFTKDSTIFLQINPILWAGTRQMTSDLIEMKSYANAPDQVRLFKQCIYHLKTRFHHV